MDSWMCQNLDIDYDCAKLFMKKFPKLTFQNGNDLVVWEWLGLYYSLATRPECSVTPLNWQEYKKAMLSGTGKMWDLLLGANLIFGGMEFDADFMELEILATLSRVPLHRTKSGL
ncbi:hypothetical protein L208DRAFT_1374289 [Tricholoma matsutake]|nr:hypothetical protein L208DRAFT_1374289 [Tricholoma matsutake 945]